MYKTVFAIMIIFFSIIISVANSDNVTRDIFSVKVGTNNIDLLSNGYILYQPEYSKITYLINKAGQVVHQWRSNYSQSLSAYLLENGSIIRSCYGGLLTLFWGGGFTGRVEMLDWDSNLIWEFEYVNLKHCLHNDIEPLPNGNILMIVWERISRNEAITAGCNPNFISIGGFQTDYIIEVEPTYPKGGKIVWEWHVMDHLIQDIDSTKNNYGIVADHPELVNINYRDIKRYGFGYATKTDFTHLNSINYIEEFDQLLLSFRSLNEIWIIDHSTTTEEAANHTGGDYGKGGDILYRWGNPEVYDTGDESNQKLYAQHDPRWIIKENTSEYHITIFNNGISRPGIDYSSVEEIIPPVDENGNYNLEPGSAYGPEEILWSYGINERYYYSSVLCSAQRLPNGNTLINNGLYGTFFEVTPEKELIWRYYNKYPCPIPIINAVFKLQWYPNDYSGLNNLDKK